MSENIIVPTVGRVVYYKARGSADGVFPKVDRAAIITDVRTEEGEYPIINVRLCVLNPEGMFFSGWLTQGQEGGQWDWMPFQKDQQARLSAAAAPEGEKADASKSEQGSEAVGQTAADPAASHG